MRRMDFKKADLIITQWMAKNGIDLLRISTGLIFFWFGMLKFFPGMSPAENIAGKTIATLTFGLVGERTGLVILALWEVLIGIGLIGRIYLREILFLLFIQMIGAMSPVIVFPELVFSRFPFVLTLEGQYIFKNLILISAGIVIGATVRGGRLRSEPDEYN